MDGPNLRIEKLYFYIMNDIDKIIKDQLFSVHIILNRAGSISSS